MGEAAGAGRRIRRSWPVADKRRIVELTLAPGASVARVARAHGVNANQVFVWRRAFERGELVESAALATALLPVTVSFRIRWRSKSQPIWSLWGLQVPFTSSFQAGR